MVEKDLHILPRFKDLLPALQPAEREQLEANIIEEGGVRDVILYWEYRGKNRIIDGMNRFEIAMEHGIPFRTEPRQFDSIDEAELWILENQLGRRNLLKQGEIRKLRGDLYNRLKGQERSPKGQFAPSVDAAKEVAEKSGVSKDTVKRDARYAAALGKIHSHISNRIASGDLAWTTEETIAFSKIAKDKQQAALREVNTTSKTIRDVLVDRKLMKPKPKKTAATVSASGDGPSQSVQPSSAGGNTAETVATDSGEDDGGGTETPQENSAGAGEGDATDSTILYA